MKKLTLILLILFPLIFNAQRDTINTIYGVVIPCKILEVHTRYLRYKPVKGADDYVKILDVMSYSYKGVKKVLSDKPVIKLPENTITITEDYAYLKYCMGEARREYRNGVVFTVSGGFLLGIGSYITFRNNSSTTGLALQVAGGLGVLLGYTSTAGASKWFGRASLGVNGNGASVKYILK